MSAQSFSTTFFVDQTPQEAFDAINNVRGWWSASVDGRTDQLGAEFAYSYKDIHRCAFRITELVAGKRVVWHVLSNHFNFTKDKTEWTGTDVVFDIGRTAQGKTQVHFTNVGLVPAYECYDVCSKAWGSYVTESLRSLMTTGTGQPNPMEDVVAQAQQMGRQDYTTALVVRQSPEVVFSAVNNVRGWWSQNVEGSALQPGETFTFTHQDLHQSTHHITHMVPGKRVVWRTTSSRLSFIKDKAEWTGTDIVFDIERRGDNTVLTFTHVGLAPAKECYRDCSAGWAYYIHESLRMLIETGKGQAEPSAA
jgi:hypothetical protein